MLVCWFIFWIRYDNSRYKFFWFFHIEQLSRYMIYYNCKILLCTKLFKQILITTFNAYVHVLITNDEWYGKKKKITTNHHSDAMKGFPSTALNVMFGPYQMIYSFQHLENTKQSTIYFSFSEHYLQNSILMGKTNHCTTYLWVRYCSLTCIT